MQRLDVLVLCSVLYLSYGRDSTGEGVGGKHVCVRLITSTREGAWPALAGQLGRDTRPASQSVCLRGNYLLCLRSSPCSSFWRRRHFLRLFAELELGQATIGTYLLLVRPVLFQEHFSLPNPVRSQCASTQMWVGSGPYAQMRVVWTICSDESGLGHLRHLHWQNPCKCQTWVR